MKLLHRLDDLLSKVESAVLILFLSTMMLMSFTQVMLRNIFEWGFIWGDSLLRYLVFFIGLLAASLATRDEKHINIDAFAKILSPKTKGIAAILTNLFAATVTFFLACASVDFINEGLNPADTMFLDLPVRYAGYVIVICFGMMTFRFVLRTVDNLIVMFSGTTGKEGTK
jgi:TRAP-type C4-dicarboxylate transport system permease small subunit